MPVSSLPLLVVLGWINLNILIFFKNAQIGIKGIVEEVS